MTKLIGIGALRQNPTHMLREVKEGTTYTITDRGTPIADVTPHRASRWASAAALDAVLRDLGADEQWAEDLASTRSAEKPRDPWATSR